jgi:hypothetical protein
MVPQHDPHRARADLAVSEGNLIVAECHIETADEHDFVVYHVFYIAAGLTALIEAGKAAAALVSLFRYVLRYVARHRWSVAMSITTAGSSQIAL